MFFLNIIYRWPPENYTTSLLLTLQSHIYLTIRVFSDTCNLILLFKSSTKSGDFANDSVNKCQMHHSLTTAKRFVHLYATLNARLQLMLLVSFDMYVFLNGQMNRENVTFLLTT